MYSLVITITLQHYTWRQNILEDAHFSPPIGSVGLWLAVEWIEKKKKIPLEKSRLSPFFVFFVLTNIVNFGFIIIFYETIS